MNGKTIKTVTAAAAASVPQGELGVVATIEFDLPDVGTTASVAFGATDGPKTITVQQC